MPQDDSKPAHTTPAPRLHHVNLKTTRIEEMIRWYDTVVGPMQVTFSNDRGAWITNDAAHHRVALLSSPALSDDQGKLEHTGLHHTAFEYDSLDDLLDTYVRLADLGIVPHFAVDHGMTISFYYVDPDGNSVELQADTFGNWEESSQWMRSAPEFAADPIGPQVDPLLMVEARAAGASPDELHRRAYEGEFKPDEPMDPRIPLA